MTDERTGPPIKRKAATQGSEPEQPRDFGSNTSRKYTTADLANKTLSREERRQLKYLAVELCPNGTLRRYLPFAPAWCRRIGKDVIHAIVLDPTEIRLLLDAHSRAITRLQEACEAGDRQAWKAREWLQRQKHDAPFPDGGRDA